MDNGFVVLQRKMLKWEWYQDPVASRLFFHCLLRANWKNGYWMGQKVPRGSFISGTKQLAQELALGRQQIRTSILKLKKSQNLTTKSTNKNTLYTIVNYELFQDTNQQLTSNATNEQPTANQQLTTNEPLNQVTKESIIVLPEIISDEIWKSWFDFRKKISGKKFTAHAQKLSISKLEKLYAQGENLEAVVNQSIERGYSGLFPVKGENNGNSQHSKPTSESVTRELLAEISSGKL